MATPNLPNAQPDLCPECPLLKQGVKKLIFHILLKDGNGTATVLLVALLSVLGYLCTTYNTISRSSDKLLDGQATSLAQAKENRSGLDQIFALVSSHETYMKANSKFNQEVARRLNIRDVPVFVPVDKADGGRK